MVDVNRICSGIGANVDQNAANHEVLIDIRNQLLLLNRRTPDNRPWWNPSIATRQGMSVLTSLVGVVLGLIVLDYSLRALTDPPTGIHEGFGMLALASLANMCVGLFRK